MKSIKEKANEYGKNWYDKNGSFSNDRCRGCYVHVTSSYEAGANYVLDTIATVLNQPMNDYLVLEEVWNTFKELKSNQ